MFAQNFFYYTFSISIIILALMGIVSIIFGLVILKKIYSIFNRIDKTVEMLKEKIKISAFVGLISQGIKEIIEFVREKRKK